MKQPLVSVIIPSYNHPLFLRTRSIPSVLRQSYSHWEIIVVGDGPEDESLRQSVMQFDDPRIRYVDIPRPDYSSLQREQFWHVAGAAARNFGLSIAHGDIIAPLDDDDEFMENHLADCARLIGSGEADFVYGKVLVRDIETGQDYEDYFSWADETNRALFPNRNILFHSSVCYSKEFAHLRYPLDGRIAADYGLWLSIFHAGARFTSSDHIQAIYYGDSLNKTIRVNVPSLPPREEFIRCVDEIFTSRMLSNGGVWCRRFEQAIADYVSVPDVVSAPNGDAALVMAFRALKMICPTKTEVILPSYTFPSTANAIQWNGFELVFCDVDPATLCMTAEIVKPLISADTAAIVPVHAHGNPCDMPSLENLAKERGVFLISDAAPAFGAMIAGRRIGSFGDMEVLSFSGTKVFTAGEGGAVCCTNPNVAQILRRVGRYGINEDYISEMPGINGKLAELPAALALIQLPTFPEQQARRRMAAERYHTLLAEVPRIRLQGLTDSTATSAWKDLALVLPSAHATDRLIARLSAYRIESRPYYKPLHVMPAFMGCARGSLVTTDALIGTVLCIPIYNDIRNDTINFVVDVIREALL